MNTSAIPTTYKSTRFRSRLEAKWAAFFDLMGWSWHYEPIDLDGYIPDFVLDFAKPLLIEVKPAMSREGLMDATTKIESGGWEGEAMVIGAWPMADLYLRPALGLLLEAGPSWNGWDDAILFQCLGCKRASIHHTSGSFHCRVSGCYDGDGHHGSYTRESASEAWATASNATQWRAPA